MIAEVVAKGGEASKAGGSKPGEGPKSQPSASKAGEGSKADKAGESKPGSDSKSQGGSKSNGQQSGEPQAGEVVRVLFVIDACDREIIAWSAVANAGISGEMVRDLMIASVERRFGTTKAPHRVEWLSDNGSACIAKPTAETAAALGLTLLFTPVRSPESNGMSESFVKTLKRDYPCGVFPDLLRRPGPQASSARVTTLPDAATILAKLPDWIEDYCEVHPHSGLKFRSPREFIRLSA